VNYRKLYEKELARANRNAVAFHMLRREVEHASKVASELHHSMERDSMGILLPPYARLAIIANKQAANAAYMVSIKETVQ
jgi:hypothetical protein